MTGLRKLRREEKKERLLKEAIGLFIKKGFEGTNIEDITLGAGVAKGTFYNFFDKKEDVILYYLDNEIVKSRYEIQRRINLLKNIDDKLKLIFVTVLKYIFRNKDFARVLVKERIVSLGAGSNWNELILMQTIKQVFAEAMEKGEIKKDIDLADMSEFVFGVFTMYIIYWLNGMIKTKKELVSKVSSVVRMFIEGIGCKNSL